MRTISLIKNKYIFLESIMKSETNHSSIIRPNNDLFNRKLFISKTNFQNVCWKCGIEQGISSLFCDKCNALQHPKEKENLFKVLSMEEDFKMDEGALKNKFRKMQSLIHPDKFSNRSSAEQSISEEYSSLINKAYNILQTPLKRAEHLLELKGQKLDENDKIDDPEFLMEMMSLNEEVEEAGDNKQLLKNLFEKNKCVIDQLEKEIEDNFRSNSIEKTKKNVIKLKYFISIHNKINKILRELGVTD
ncbi:unnamed protein product [Acanthoscelides obtectus]|uniref:J domain-containing protein n=1 Tax=Acanthoscelides obtectus TaxID=200917 RepID=A0A9P0Q573_ACAOB|nr:unnamed protein product [Acanthoscelides obtectus]CAK1664519.1 Iron-sulfur cluster co-chaperone protein HscB, mitochondrial [Acanthoscelides obtectus]